MGGRSIGLPRAVRRRTPVGVTLLLLATVTAAVAGTAPAGADPEGYGITSAVPPAGVIGSPYSHAFTGAPDGAVWSVTGANLPPGLTLDPNTGVLSGTPTAVGTTTDITVHATWSGYRELSAGGFHTCALTPAGGADCWGSDSEGQAAAQSGPFSALTAGAFHTCGLTASGAADCWGRNVEGQAADQAGPYTALAAGSTHTCGLTPAGAAHCWGNDGDGQAAGQAGPFTALGAGENHTCGLTVAGAVHCWGKNADGQAVGQAGPFTGLAVGGRHSCGLTPDGAAHCWGFDFFGQAADQPGPFTALTAGYSHTCGRTVDGAAQCWGNANSGMSDDQPGPFTALTAGASHTCGLTPNGGARCWGNDFNGQAADRAGTGPFTELTAGRFHTCGLTPAGAAHCWGRNDEGQAANQPGPFVALSAGGLHTCGLTPAGAADCWGNDGDGQTASQPGPFTALTTGEGHSCGLTPAGAAHCWGRNDEGQAADQVGPFSAVTAGDLHTCALTLAGAAHCWGSDTYGQAEDRPGPYTSVVAGNFHNCGLTPTGAAECWGNDAYSQNEGRPGPFTALVAGLVSNCGLTPTGGAQCWGYNDAWPGPADRPGPYTALTYGMQHTCGLTPTGGAHCVGFNNDGQAEDQTVHAVGSDSQTFSIAVANAAGLLRVTTNPAVPAEIIVDGIPRDSWGLNWVEFPLGAHQVCFGPAPGYTPPPCQNVVVHQGQTTTVEGSYTRRGNLRVQTSPAVASTITIDGAPANDWGVWTDVGPGTYQVCFGAVVGFDPPDCQDAVVTAGGNTTLTGTFTANPGAPGPDPNHGFLRATTNPARASRITIDGQVADTWGLTWLKLAPGDHQVCFEAVLHSSAPACQDITIAAAFTTTVTGNFVAHGFLRVLTSPAVDATVTIDGEPANAWGVWTSKPPGTYEVCYGPADGFTTPPCEDVDVTAGATSTVTGTYT